MRHTDEEIEDASHRFEQLADALDPATAEVDHIDDLRQIAVTTQALRSDDAGLRETVEAARRMAGPGTRSLSLSESPARRRDSDTTPTGRKQIRRELR